MTIGRTRQKEMDKIIGLYNGVLDHGFVRVIDYMGDDNAIVQAARVSYGEGTKTPATDAALIDYLMRHRHTSPFEMCQLKLHIKMPIFVARQWVRHRTASLNEVSARYSILPDEQYMPPHERFRFQSSDNKQGTAAEGLPPVRQSQMRDLIKDAYEEANHAYGQMLDHGVARELSRITMPVAQYTEMYWTMDLHNLFHLLKLRADSHAQEEIRAYAEVIARIVKTWVPMAFESFENHVLNSATFSGHGLESIKAILEAHGVSYQELVGTLELHGVKGRECAETAAKLGLTEPSGI